VAVRHVVTYSSGHCSEIGVYWYIEGFLSLVSGRTVKLNDVEHFQGIGGRDLCRLGPRAFIDSATLKDRHQTLCSKTTIMPTISGGGDEYLTRQSDKALNGKMSVAYIGGPINAMR
jgi:hypothetical protein